MIATELLAHLTAYINQSPENGTAEVLLKMKDGLAYGIERGDDARAPGQLYLVLVPNLATGGLGVINGRVQ